MECSIGDARCAGYYYSPKRPGPDFSFRADVGLSDFGYCGAWPPSPCERAQALCGKNVNANVLIFISLRQFYTSHSNLDYQM